MSQRDMRGVTTINFVVAAVLIAGGLTVCGVSLLHLPARDQVRLAQATQQEQPKDQPAVPAGKQDGPAEATPGDTRPTTPPPEPARPDADAQKAGAKPALPPAPAEKMGEPVGK